MRETEVDGQLVVGTHYVWLRILCATFSHRF